jgi:hypothetical protein
MRDEGVIRITSRISVTGDDLLLLVRRAGHKHAGVGAPALQFV